MSTQEHIELLDRQIELATTLKKSLPRTPTDSLYNLNDIIRIAIQIKLELLNK